MIRASDHSKLLDPLKQSEYKTYLKGSKVICSQNSYSNRKINKNSTILQNIKSTTSALSDKNGPNSQRNAQTVENRLTLTNRDGLQEGSVD